MNYVFIRLRSQCRTSAYSGTEVADLLVVCTNPRRLSSRNAACTADFDRPVPSASRCKLTATRFCSERYSSAQKKR